MVAVPRMVMAAPVTVGISLALVGVVVAVSKTA